jgi:hypothetical protein
MSDNNAERDMTSNPMMAAQELTPQALVQAQVDAYNAHNIDDFLAVYADDIELFDFPAKTKLRGKDVMRQRYAALTADPQLHGEVINCMVVGNTVINHERVCRTTADGTVTLESIAIYEIRDQKIVRVTFITDGVPVPLSSHVR